jgi:cytochrome c biogenesis protein
MNLESPVSADAAPPFKKSWKSTSFELLSSMRFAISLLCLISIASVIGTVLQQSKTMPEYVNKFGPFWFEVFNRLSLTSLYSAWWFLLIMSFLVISTSLCLLRNTPKMINDMKSWRENVREQSLQNFHHKGSWETQQEPTQLSSILSQQLQQLGYKTKLIEKDQASLISAKQGTGNKWGYIFAHSAIVIIIIGALFDSDLPIRVQKWFMGKVPFEGSGVLMSDIPEKHRLALSTPGFRGNAFIPEGGSSSVAVIPQQSGVLLQDLPFTIQLKKFHIDFYPSGMPKLFASDVLVKDHDTGQVKEATIKVNHPLIHKGIAIYQSSFEDGGTQMRFKAHAMQGERNESFELQGIMNGSAPLRVEVAGKAHEYQVEWTEFRPFNVENTVQAGQDLRAVNPQQTFSEKLGSGISKHMGSAAKDEEAKHFKNVGPSFKYKLRDKTGQAREFHNYMQPVEIDGSWVFLAGVREQLSDQFKYLRIPADENDSLNEWMRLRSAISNPQMRSQAAQQFAQRALANNTDPQVRKQVTDAAQLVLSNFAGESNSKGLAGFAAVNASLENKNVSEKETTAKMAIQVLYGAMWDLWQLQRQADKLPILATDDKNMRFLEMVIPALSDAYVYGAPVYLQMTGFDEVKASVFQLARAPGQNIVYLGCLLLIMGVYAMFYIRERRVWIWIKQEDQTSRVLMAMSSQRKTLDFEKEFEQLKQRMSMLIKPNV